MSNTVFQNDIQLEEKINKDIAVWRLIDDLYYKYYDIYLEYLSRSILSTISFLAASCFFVYSCNTDGRSLLLPSTLTIFSLISLYNYKSRIILDSNNILLNPSSKHKENLQTIGGKVANSILQNFNGPTEVISYEVINSERTLLIKYHLILNTRHKEMVEVRIDFFRTKCKITSDITH